MSSLAVRVWMVVVYGMILTMVVIGGITRLTGSGLSMVEWHPLMGLLPPLGDAAWQEAFEKYQQFPQYQNVNHWMTVDDFARIFFWEYVHRVWGRLIGLVAGLPWIVFVLTGRLRGMEALKTFGMIVLGGLQGLLGWYMVKSGLVDVPTVSHLRLAAHLSLAFFVAQVTLWLGLGAWSDRRGRTSGAFVAASAGLWGLVAVQTVWGAFMAGTRAGFLASTFPSMQGHYSPAAFVGANGWLSGIVFEPLMIHWVHRALGFIVLGAGFGLVWLARRHPVARTPGVVIGILLTLQFVLGVLTVVTGVSLPIAVAHQANALLTLSAITWLIRRASGSP